MTRTHLTLLFALACVRESPLPAGVISTTDSALQHHDIRFEQLPAPFASRSAGNPPVASPAPSNATLHVPPGFQVSLYASGLSNPRTMLLTRNGDVLVTETAAGRITLLRDANHDGVAELRYPFATSLNQPYGLAVHDRWPYVGDTDGVVRFAYVPGQTAARGEPEKIAPLPSGGHSTRGLLFDRSGTHLFVSVGSASNVRSGEDPERAAILQMNPDGTARRIFASGLRNPVGMAWQPGSNALWTAVNERDGLGDDLVPDYATEVKDGAFYGWPYAYLGPHEEPRRKGERPDLVKRTIAPSVLIQAHSAPLGIVFYEGAMFPKAYRGNAFVALHGSWNRSRRTGYKVVSIPFRNGKPAGGYDDFVTGWMTDETSRTVWGRPVGLLVLADGSLLISEDENGTIWRVSYQTSAH